MPSQGFDLSLWVALAVGVLICGFFLAARSRFLSIPVLRAVAPAASPPDCMVVIPARDEESLIGRAVQSFPHDSVIVVDDHSSDRTAEAARKAGAGVLPAPDLPRGAVGKAHACLTAARVLTSKWILFADADTFFAAGSLESAVACADASGSALLSILADAELVTWSEQILYPYAQALFFAGVAPRRNPAAVFNGQCLLVRRDAYEFLGGHAAVMNSLVDDVKLAGLAQRHRLKFSTVRGGRLARARFRGAGASFRRAAYRFLLLNFWAAGAVLLAALMASLWLPAVLWLMTGHHPLGASILAIPLMLLMLPWYKNFWRTMEAPVAIYFLLPILFRAAIAAVLGQPVQWKGRMIC